MESYYPKVTGRICSDMHQRLTWSELYRFAFLVFPLLLLLSTVLSAQTKVPATPGPWEYRRTLHSGESCTSSDQPWIDEIMSAYRSRSNNCEGPIIQNFTGYVLHGSWNCPPSSIQQGRVNRFTMDYGSLVYPSQDCIHHTLTFDVHRYRHFTCPDGGTVGVEGVGLDAFYYCLPQYYLAIEPERNCSTYRANPCDAATGNKYQVEIDIPTNGITPGFIRYYNSQGSNGGFSDMGVGWSHNYRQQLDTPVVNDYHIRLGVKSSLYNSPNVACTQAWQEIKQKAFRGLYANATASYADGVCKVTLGTAASTLLPLQASLDEPPPAAVHTISRPNGTTHTFIQEEGVWEESNGAKVNLSSATEGWRFEDADGTVEIYGNDGKLLSSTTLLGHTTTYTYTPEGKLWQVVGPMGHMLTFTYADGRLVSVASPDNKLYQYRYDAAGNLEQVIYPDDTLDDDTDNPSRTYHYEDTRFPHALTGITNENGVRFATWAYDEEGRAILSEHADGAERVEFTYNPDGTTTVIDALGQINTYHFQVVKGGLKPVRIERQYQ